MATAKQIAWRKKFALRYGKKKGRSKAKAATRTPKGGNTMARRRLTRRSPRRARSAASYIRRRVYRRSSKEFIFPAADLATGFSFLDGAMGPGKRATSTVLNVGLGAIGAKGYSIDNGIEHAKIGATQFASDPAMGLINGVKASLPVLAYRWGAKKLGIQKSYRIFKGFRVQVR